MSLTIHAPRQWTVQEQLRSQEHPGRKPGSLAGSYVDELAARHNLVLLCTSCRGKFNYRQYGYLVDGELKCFSRCDDCRNHAQTTAFFHEAEHAKVRPASARRGRWSN